MTTTAGNPSLKRSLGVVALTLYGIGAIIGAGIYVLIGEVAGAAGYFAPLSFFIAAVVALFSALSYAELSARFPYSAGEAIYVQEAFAQPLLTWVIGILVIFTGIVSTATLSVGVVGYFTVFFDWHATLVISLFVVVIGAIAIWGINQSAWVVGTITLIESGGLLYVISIADFSGGVSLISKSMFEADIDMTIASGIFLGSFLAFFAFIGFEDMVNVAEEVKKPESTLPKSILFALVVATLLYIAVITAALSTLAPDKLGSSNAPLADVVTAHGYSAHWIALISLIAVVNGAIVQLIMASRVIFGMARNRLLPATLAYVNSSTSTPIYATLVAIGITLLLALTFPLGTLAQATSVIVLTVFLLVNVSLIAITRKNRSSDTLHFPGWVPAIGALLCATLLALKVVDF